MPSSKTSKKNGKKGGRPKGSTTKPQIRDYFTKTEIKQLASNLKAKAKEDNNILKFLAELVFGKASQTFEGDVGGEIVLRISKEIADKNEK